MCHGSTLSPLKVAPASRRLSREHLKPRHYFFFFAAVFLPVLFLGAAFFFACPLAACPLMLFTSASDSCSSTRAAFLTFGCFFATAGALKLCPSKAISVMRTRSEERRV